MPNCAELSVAERERMITGNLGLVYDQVGRFFGKGHPQFEDFVSAGTLGLIKAVDGFDTGRGFKFSTYAYWQIRGALTAHTRVERMQEERIADLRHMLEGSRVRRGFKWVYNTERCADPGPHKQAVAEAVGGLSLLPDRLRRVLELRYLKGLTFRQVGREIGVSHERARQLQEEALVLVRQKMRGQHVT